MESSDDRATAMDLYWQAYIKFVAETVGMGHFGPNDTRAVFVSPSIASSVPASAFIPEAVTNQQLYQMVNELLNPASGLYEPVTGSSYYDAVREYITHVIVPSEVNEGAQKRLLDARKDLEVAIAEMNFRKAEAVAAFNTDPDPDKRAFKFWVQENAPFYTSARDVYLDKVGKHRSALHETVGGTASQDLERDENKFVNIESAKIPGSNPSENRQLGCMPSFQMQASNLELLIDNAAKEPNPMPVPEPADNVVEWLPGYRLDPTYRSQMDAWTRDFAKTEDSELKLSTDKGRSFEWSNYGQKTLAGKAGVSYFGLFRVGAGHGQTQTWNKVDSDFDEAELEVTITWKDMKMFSVSPGSWDIPNMYEKYPQLEAGAKVKDNLIRPTHLICASGLGARIRFDEKSFKSAKSHTEEVSNSGGGGRATFGFLGINAGVKGGNSSVTDTHEFEWDEANKTLLMRSRPGLGSCHLLGIVGQRLAKPQP